LVVLRTPYLGKKLLLILLVGEWTSFGPRVTNRITYLHRMDRRAVSVLS
jgi:hypothetical protein